MNKIPNRAKLFLAAVMLAAVATTVYAMRGTHSWHLGQSLVLLVVACLASRLKLKLPGLNGNMSVNLPFILVAVVQLSLLEAVVVGVASTVVQCFPKDGGKLKAVQLLFNASLMASAVGMGNWILRQALISRVPSTSASLLLSLAAASFFLVQTIPVATVISLTEGGGVLAIWTSICQLSFPYYVLSAGVTSLVTTASHRFGWQIPLLVLPVMYGVHCSYRHYFGGRGDSVRPRFGQGGSGIQLGTE